MIETNYNSENPGQGVSITPQSLPASTAEHVTRPGSFTALVAVHRFTLRHTNLAAPWRTPLAPLLRLSFLPP